MSQIFIGRPNVNEIQTQTAKLVAYFVSVFPQVNPKTNQIEYVFSNTTAKILWNLAKKNDETASLNLTRPPDSISITLLQSKILESFLVSKYSPKLELEQIQYGLTANELQNTALLVPNIFPAYNLLDVYSVTNPRYSIKAYATENAFLLRSYRNLFEIFYPLTEIRKHNKDILVHLRKDLKAIKIKAKVTKEEKDRIEKIKLPEISRPVFIEKPG